MSVTVLHHNMPAINSAIRRIRRQAEIVLTIFRNFASSEKHSEGADQE